MLIPFGILAGAGGAGPSVGPAFDLLESVILGSSASSVSFTGLDTYAADYKHLQIRYAGKSDGATRAMFMRFNAATGPYQVHSLASNGFSVSSQSTSETVMEFPVALKSTNTVDYAGAGVFDILDFSSTTKNKAIRGLYGAENITLASGGWFATTAMTSITFSLSSGNYRNISRFSLYGVKG